LRKRIALDPYIPYLDDTEKQAACELLHGPVDWDAVRRRAAVKGGEDQVEMLDGGG
jgi:hypothetical protein